MFFYPLQAPCTYIIVYIVSLYVHYMHFLSIEMYGVM